MRVTDLEVAVLHAQLTGNDEGRQRPLTGQLPSGDLSGLAVLMHAAFVVAARRKFGPAWSRAEVTRYVARVRTLITERPALLDPLTGEDELRRALGEPVAAAHEVGAVAASRLTLLLALVASLDLDDQAIAGLLSEGRDAANRTLSDTRST